MRSILALVVAAVAVAPAPVLAQQSQFERVVGTIASADGLSLVIKTRQGEAKVTLGTNPVVFGVIKRDVTDIKPGQFLGVGATPQPDGSQKAVRINIFPPGESPNPGFRPWQGAPQGTMTNANVSSVVASVEGHAVMVKYQDGEKKIIIQPDTQIVGTVPGDAGELTVGAAVVIARASRKSDGTFEASRINVGRDGVVPQ